MIHPTVLDDHGHDIHTGAPPIYRLEEPILDHEQCSDADELPPAWRWAMLVIVVAGAATFAWLALH
jgi:hypothetical protein